MTDLQETTYARFVLDRMGLLSDGNVFRNALHHYLAAD